MAEAEIVRFPGLSRAWAIAINDNLIEVRRKRHRTRDAAMSRSPEDRIVEALIEHRGVWPAALAKVEAAKDKDGWLVDGRYHIPGNPAGRPKGPDGKSLTYLDAFRLIAKCRPDDDVYAKAADVLKKLGIDLGLDIGLDIAPAVEATEDAEEARLMALFDGDDEPDVAVVIRSNGSDTTGTPEPDAKAKKKKKKKKKRGAPAGERNNVPLPDSEDDFPGGIPPEATEDFVRNDHGVIYANSQRNMRLAIAKLGIGLSYDSFAARMLITEGKERRALGDPEIERAYLTIDARFGFLPARELFWMVVRDAARWSAFHPVRDYLDALRWDHKSRLDTWLTYYAGAEDTPYTRAVGRLILVAAVRRIRQPGVKFDEMLVLEGPQGNNKSTALAVLAVKPDWFSDDLPLNVSGKEVIERTGGKWIVEAAELSGMRQGLIEHIKAFLSRQIDIARMAYSRMPTERPREFVVIGTTNSERYLKDSTGNRRFWPVKVEGFDLEVLAHDRDQLWAEAVEAEENREAIRLDPELYPAAGEQQDRRRVPEPWLDVLQTAIGHLTRGKMLAESAWAIVNRPTGQLTQADYQRLGEAMRQMGWERKKKRFRVEGRSRPHWGYVVDDGSEPSTIPLPEVTATRDGTGALQITITEGERDDIPEGEPT